MKLSSALRAKPVLVGGIALAVTLSRCSPIGSSFDKNAHHGGTLTSGSLPGQPSAGAIHVFVYKTRVMDGDSYSSTVSSIPSAQRITLTGADAAFTEFRANKQVQISLPATFAPDEGSGYFEVTVSSTDISAFDLNAFETTFKPIADGTWILMVSPNVPDDVTRRVLDSLTEITISVNTAVGTGGSSLTAANTGVTAPAPTGGAAAGTGVAASSGSTGATGPSGAR